MSPRHSTKVLSDFAWTMWLLVAAGAFIWLPINFPWIAAAWFALSLAVAPIVIMAFHANEGGND